tara:strand:+ start:20564 stop:20923 length:360 start_codon:yes stop_codon:yes gene_type:complete
VLCTTEEFNLKDSENLLEELVREGVVSFKELKCNCGLPVRYTHGEKGDSCNKYAVCPTYDELLESTRKEERYRWAYRNFVNQIDDYFEYRNESLKDRKKVQQLLGNLTDKMADIEESKL